MSEQRVISYKIEVDDAPVKSLKQQLREATLEAQRLATAEVVDQEALEAAIAKTAELKDQMADVNEQVAVFASGSKYEQAGNALGQVKSALLALDFEKAQERAASFATVAKSINFGDAIKSVMQLGKTFITLGKALLTNPLFLLAAVIAGVVYIVYKLLDALGVIKIAMDALKAVIGGIIDAFYALTDAIGLTSKAAEKNLEEAKKNAEEKEKAIAKYYNQAEFVLSNELKLLKANADGSEESAQRIIEAERKLLLVKQQAAKEQARLAENVLLVMISSGKATKEELDAQREKVLALRNALTSATTDIKVFDAQVKESNNKKAKEQADEEKKNREKADEARKRAEQARKQIIADSEKFILDLERQREDYNISLIQDEIERNKRRDLIALERKNADIDFSKMTAEAKLQWDIWYIDEKARIEKEADAARMEQLRQQQEIFAAETEAAQKAELERIAEQEKMSMEMQIEAQKQLQAAKSEALLAGLALMSSIFSGNEKIQKALFLVEKGKAAADVIVNGLKAQGVLAAQLAVGTGLLGNPITAAAGAAQVAAAKAGMTANKIGMATALAGIAASTIDRFKQGGGAGALGGGGGTPSVSASMGQAQATPQINMFENQQNNQPISGVNRVSVVDYTDIQNTGNRVAMLQNAVSLG